MKKEFLTIILLFTLTLNNITAQESIMVENLNGTEFDLEKISIGADNQPVLFFTWARKWCWPCVKTLDEFNKDFATLQQKYNLKLIALNLDSEYTRQEIKTFVNERAWDFDVYMDSDKNYMTATNTTSAPITLLFFNNKAIASYSGFIDGVAEPESTADYFMEIINGLFGNIIYFDENWDYTTKEYATYVRYRDKIGDVYEVTDRWVTGEIQMRGSYTDFHCTNKTGEFKYYNKDGTLESTNNY